MDIIVYKGKLDINQAEEILHGKVVAQLATAKLKNCQPHVVPVWFLWDGESIIISGFISTRKIKELTRNPRCSILVNSDLGASHAVLLDGVAEVFDRPSQYIYEQSVKVYTKYMGEGAKDAEPQSWAKDMENRIVKLTPKVVYAW